MAAASFFPVASVHHLEPDVLVLVLVSVHLLEPDVLGVLMETLTAHVQAVFADQTVTVASIFE